LDLVTGAASGFGSAIAWTYAREGARHPIKAIRHAVRASPPILSRRNSGVVVDVGSAAAIRPRPGSTWRNGCRGAVNIASRPLAVGPAPRGSRVDAVVPMIGGGLAGKLRGPARHFLT